MEERYHATTQNRFYPDMFNVNKNITVEAKLISPLTYMCVCVCVFVYLHDCIWTLSAHVRTCVCVCVCVCVYLHYCIWTLSAHLRTCVCVPSRLHMNLISPRTYVRVCVCVCVCVCTFTTAYEPYQPTYVHVCVYLHYCIWTLSAHLRICVCVPSLLHMNLVSWNKSYMISMLKTLLHFELSEIFHVLVSLNFTHATAVFVLIKLR